MKKILIPIDGSERSKISVDLLKKLFEPGDIHLVIFIVKEEIDEMTTLEELDDIKYSYKEAMDNFAKELKPYNVEFVVKFGNPSKEILDYANEKNIDIIIMIKSGRRGWYKKLGSVTAYVVKNADCVVIVVPVPKQENE